MDRNDRYFTAFDMWNLHVKPTTEIRTTKYHDHHLFHPSHDEVAHIHCLVYAHWPTIRNQVRKIDVSDQILILYSSQY